MKCVQCGHDGLKATTTALEVRIGDHLVRGSVPAEACPKCKEVYVDGRVHERFELRVASDVARSGNMSGESFRFMRKSLGFHAKALGELIDTPPETISRWETGSRPVDRFAWITLATMVIDQAEARTPATRDVLRAVAKPKPFPKVVKVA